MSININVYYNSSEPIALDKTLTLLGSYTGSLRSDTSLMDPVILMGCEPADIAAANYLSIPTFSRSYFIKEVRSVRTGLCQLLCHVDVLSSFATGIRANEAIVRRQENRWNLYLNDGVFKVYQDPIITTHKFPEDVFNGQQYVLTLAGRRGGGVSVAVNKYNELISGADISSKTMAGLAAYALYHVGNPYWFGTYGQTASVDLYNERSVAYPEEYTATDFADDYGQQVFDCVGLIKGYRWSSTLAGTPTYVPSQDVSVSGLYAQCSAIKGRVGDQRWSDTYHDMKGVCLFTQTYGHVGVSMGDGTVIEARGHAYGVQRNNLSDRNFYYYGIPDWLISRQTPSET